METAILTKDYSGEKPIITLKVGEEKEKIITETQAHYLEILNDKGLPELIKAILENKQLDLFKK